MFYERSCKPKLNNIVYRTIVVPQISTALFACLCSQTNQKGNTSPSSNDRNSYMPLFSLIFSKQSEKEKNNLFRCFFCNYFRLLRFHFTSFSIIHFTIFPSMCFFLLCKCVHLCLCCIISRRRGFLFLFSFVSFAYSPFHFHLFITCYQLL